MLLRIDHNAEEPLYLQICSQIIEAIAKGELHSGDSLPSVRTLARDLSINLHTVNKAYAVLRDEGYVIMRGRKGATIANPRETVSASMAEETKNRTREMIQSLSFSWRAHGGSKEELKTLMSDVIDEVFTRNKEIVENNREGLDR